MMIPLCEWPDYIRFLEKRPAETESKLRELVDAAEWLDTFDDTDPWWHEYNIESVQMDEIQKIYEAAWVKYQAALKAAKE